MAKKIYHKDFSAVKGGICHVAFKFELLLSGRHAINILTSFYGDVSAGYS